MAALFYTADTEDWRQYLCPIGGLQKWINLQKSPQLPDWMTAEEMAKHKSILEKTGYGPGTNWYDLFISTVFISIANFSLALHLTAYRYKALIQGVDLPNLAGIPADRNRVNLPTLLVVSSKDYATRADMGKQATAMWVKDLRIEELDCGHWIQLEMPEKLNALLEGFAGERA
jgi:soluble epoxide hydrolase/lipid-phosphate phosphatase